MDLHELYETNKNFKSYCDHWINNPGSEYMNAGKTLSLDQIFEFEIVKAYAEVLLNSGDSSDFSGTNGIVENDVFEEDKSC